MSNAGGSPIIKYMGLALFTGAIFYISMSYYSIPFQENMVPSIANTSLIILGIIFAVKGIKELIKPEMDFSIDQKILISISGLAAIYIGAISLVSNFIEAEWIKQAFQVGQTIVILLGMISLTFVAVHLGRKKFNG